MFTIEVSQKMVFQIEFEVTPKENIEKVVIELQSKFSNPDRVRFQNYKDHSKLYVEVSIEDCTPVLNLTRDIIRDNNCSTL